VKLRTFALLGLVAGLVAGAVLWRRSSGAPQQAVQLGIAAAPVRTLDPADPATAELQALAAGVRDAFTGGA
jgi:hypothetical protein